MLTLDPKPLVIFVSVGLYFLLQTVSWNWALRRVSSLRKPSYALCQTNSTIHDVLVVIKINTPARDALSSQASSFLPCLPRLAVYSIVEEDVDGVHVHDLLDEMGPAMTEKHAEFTLYAQMRELKETHRPFQEVISLLNDSANEDSAQKLERWTFLPLIQKTRDLPPASWYVFIEDDTYLAWSNLLHYLEQFDAQIPLYLGASPANKDDDPFAQREAGFVLSRPALEKAADLINGEPGRILKIAEQEPQGDKILGKVLGMVGVYLTQSWPSFQDKSLSSLPYAEDHWCSSPVTYHHMPRSEMVTLWEFEQAWLSRSDYPFLHLDVFKHLVQPRIGSYLANWDNLSNEPISIERNDANEKIEEAKSRREDNNGTSLTEDDHKDAEKPKDMKQEVLDGIDDCREHCVIDTACVQFSWRPRECRLSHEIKLGVEASSEGIMSSFMVGRIKNSIPSRETCMSPKAADSP